AYGAMVSGHHDQGAVYVFVEPLAGWVTGTETAKLTESDGGQNDFFGWGAAISGDTVVAGPAHTGADVFVKPQAGWASATETARLTASDATVSDVLGYAVAIEGGTIVAGDQ